MSESSPGEPSNHEQVQAITTLRSGKIVDKTIGFGIPRGIVEEKSKESESLINLVHRWIVTVFEYVVHQNMFYILTEGIIVAINELRDTGLVIL